MQNLLTESEAKTRIQSLVNDEEKRISALLFNLGFDAIDFNSEIFDDSRRKIGEIDSLFLFEDHLLIVEVTKEDLDSDSIVAWFSKWSDEGNIQRIFSKYSLSTRHSHRIFFCLHRERPTSLSANIERVLSDNTNKIVFLDEIERYEENVGVIGKWERNNFLNFLEIKRLASLRPTPAVLFYVSDKPAYAFSLSASDLLGISFLSRRYKNELGFQRAIDKKRIEKIRRAIERQEILAFPNSILVNSLSTLLPQKPPRASCPAHVTINLPQDYSSCKVIDGQHRMLGFSKVSDELARSYNLPVIAFENLSNREEIDTFIIINSEQKKVDSNLVLLLKSDSDWPLESPFFLEKIGVNIVKKLNESSCLQGKIYMGYADQKRSDTWVTLSTLVRAMMLNKFIGNQALFQNRLQDIDTPYKEIRKIFAGMKQCRFPFFITRDKFFLTNRGLRILFRFVYLFHRNVNALKISIDLNQALSILAGSITAATKKQLDSYYGEGGAKKAVEYLIESVKSSNIAEFAEFETNLKKLKK